MNRGKVSPNIEKEKEFYFPMTKAAFRKYTGKTKIIPLEKFKQLKEKEEEGNE